MLVLVLAPILILPPRAAPTAEGTKAIKTKTKTIQAGEKAGARAKVPIKGGPNASDDLWWNDPSLIKALSLTDEQREKMARVLAAYHEKLPTDRSAAAFHETLVQGKWQESRAENDKLARIAELSVRMRGDLKVDVLSLLSAEQHRELVDRCPQLIYKPWLRAMRGAAR
jgi:hypothetical protein